MPFIILTVFLIVTIWHNYEYFVIFNEDYVLYKESPSLLKSWFSVIGEWFSNSIMFNLFMLSVYMNKRYCNATKITVLSLLAINILGLMGKNNSIYSFIYDFYLGIGIIAILIAYKIQPKEKLT